MIASLSLMAVLAASPAPVMEPDPGPAYHRLQARRLEASSFLLTNYNRFEQNYLPLYAADDDPATAWVEGVPGDGKGEWLLWVGPRLQKARGYKVFVRNGFQKSGALYRANGRPTQLQLQPILVTEAGPAPAGQAVQVKLADQPGWQGFDVPTQPAVQGVRLTIQAVAAGTKYQDTCISDVRVYVDGDDDYKPEAEALAAEQIRAFVADRRAAAQQGAVKLPFELAASYRYESVFQVELKAPAGRPPPLAAMMASFAPAKGVAAQLEKAKLAAARYDAVMAAAGPSRVGPPEWRRVRASVTASTPNARFTFSSGGGGEVGNRLAEVLPFSHRRAVNLFEDQSAAWERVRRWAAASPPDRQRDRAGCVESCKVLRDLIHYNGVDVDAMTGDGQRRVCPCDGECAGTCHSSYPAFGVADRLPTTGTVVEGTLAEPTALLNAGLVYEIDRDTFIDVRRRLILYDHDLAAVAVTESTSGLSNEELTRTVYVLEWAGQDAGPPRLAAVTAFVAVSHVDPEGDFPGPPSAAVMRWTAG